MSSLLKYVSNPYMINWLSSPSNDCTFEERILSKYILEILEKYVSEMESHCKIPNGGIPRWKGAGDIVNKNIISSLRSERISVNKNNFNIKLVEYKETLYTESCELEDEIRGVLSQLVVSQISKFPDRPSESTVRSQMDDSLRSKVYRLVELPLWIQAVEKSIENIQMKNHSES